MPSPTSVPSPQAVIGSLTAAFRSRESLSSSSSIPRSPASSASLPSLTDAGSSSSCSSLASLSSAPNEHLAVLQPRNLWKQDIDAPYCDTFLCRKPFTLIERRHVCVTCARIFRVLACSHLCVTVALQKVRRHLLSCLLFAHNAPAGHDGTTVCLPTAWYAHRDLCVRYLAPSPRTRVRRVLCPNPRHHSPSLPFLVLILVPFAVIAVRTK